MLLAPDRSPTTQVRISAQQQKNRVTFSSRIVSAADGSELWHLSRPAVVGELRPNTTSTSSRHIMDGQKPSLGRKVSDNHIHFGHMKVVGYAAGYHGGVGGDMRDKVSSAAIAEDEEIMEDEPSTSFTITGKSGIFRELLHCYGVELCMMYFILQSPSHVQCPVELNHVVTSDDDIYLLSQ